MHTHLNGMDSTGHWTYCSGCNYKSPTTPHTLNGKYTNHQHWHECSCGYSTTRINHTFVWYQTSDGHFQYCSDCYYNHSALYTEPHEMSEPETVRDATCTQDGEMVSWCSLCGYEARSVISKIDHNYSSSVSDGYKHFTCTMCGHTYKEPITDTPTEDCENHVYGEWYTDDTLDDSKVEYRKCEICGETETRKKNDSSTKDDKDNENETFGDYLFSGCSGALRLSTLSLFALFALMGIVTFRKKRI